MNVYIDPGSRYYLNNALFEKEANDSEDDFLLIWRHLKEYCRKRDIILNTADFWNKDRASKNDIYVSLGHKNFAKRFYWKLKNKNHSADLKNFKKRILLQGEPPVAEPEAYQSIKGLVKIYDQVYFPFKSGDSRARYYLMPFSRDETLSYWQNADRKFLTMIHANRSPRSVKKILLLAVSGGFRYLGHKELFSERIKAIKFFSRTSDIDLYGYDWDKPPFFPYWFYKKSIQKVYKGSIPAIKLRKLSEYNFALTFENCFLPGYISEKIFDCFYAGTIPVYLGATDIQEYIPKECFVDMRDFKNYGELKKFLKSLTPSEIQEYRDNAQQFLRSPRMEPFTNKHFIEFFVNMVSEKD